MGSRIISTVNNLGILYTDQGKLGEAGKMYQRTVQDTWSGGCKYRPALQIIFAAQGHLDEAKYIQECPPGSSRPMQR